MEEQVNDVEHAQDDSERSAASKPVENDGATVFERLVDWFVDSDPWQVRRYVRDLRARFPDANNDELARKVVSLKSLKNGFIGAATGTPGFLAFPVSIPADLVMSWKIQINMAMCIAHIYGHPIDSEDPHVDSKTDVYLILAGNSSKDCLRVFGIHVDAVTRKTIKRYLTREITIELWKHLACRIIATAGVKSLSRMSRAIPLVGAPIGFAFDYAAARSVGECACEYYGPTHVEMIAVTEPV